MTEQFREKLKMKKMEALKAFDAAKKEPSLEVSETLKQKVGKMQKDTIEEFKAVGMDPKI